MNNEQSDKPNIGQGIANIAAAERSSSTNINGQPIAERPQSAVSGMVGICGLIGLFAGLAVARNFGDIAAFMGYPGLPALADGPYAALIALLFCGLPMVAWSLIVDKVHLRQSTGLDWTLKRSISDVLDISIIKIAGLWATWCGIAALYIICRWYWFAPYDFSMKMFELAVIPLVVISVPYVVWIDRYMVNPRDGAWHFGAFLSGHDGWDKDEIFHHLRAWAVKGFFLAFMISIVPGGYGEVVRMDFGQLMQNPVSLAMALIIAMFLLDVQFATVGYLLTMKPLDAHIRTANPYLAGWLAALMCYPPFLLMNDGGPLFYRVNTSDWAYWFADNQTILTIWGAWLVILTAIYAWATVAFGLRFSNLTHRGILTNGPYRWTKHPAYLSKNTYWWFCYLPFLVTSDSYYDAIRNTILLAAVSAVYYWRARTEEKHLMADPIYRDYAQWMDENALIPRSINRAARILRPKGLSAQRLIEKNQIQPAE